MVLQQYKKGKIMKLLTLILFVLCLSASNAYSYTSGNADPFNDVPDREHGTIIKSATSGVSDAISRGDILSLDVDNTNDGGTATRVGANTTIGSQQVVCIATQAIATGNINNIRCLTKGFVDFLSFDASTAIAEGSKLCPNAVGAAVVCAACAPTAGGSGDNDCKFGNASESSGIISLEAKASGTGTDLKVKVNIK